MTESEKIINKKESLLKKLSLWASQQNLMEDPYVVNLVKDISEDKNISFWAEQEPLNLIPPINVVKGSRYIKIAKILALMRNVLVFLPVALTWKSVSDATEGFAKFVEQNDSTPINFLEFWQNGYGFIDDFWTISHVALVDFWIIVAVIFISLISNSFNNMGVRKQEISYQKLEKEKLAIAIEIKKYLYSSKPVLVENINQGVLESIEKLNQGLKEFNNSTLSLESLSEIVAKAMTQIQITQDNSNKVSQNNQGELEKVFSNFTAELTKGITELNDWLSQSQHDAKNMHQIFNKTLDNYVDNTYNQITKINENMELISTANSKGLEKVFDKLTEDLGQKINELNNFVYELQSSVKDLNGLLNGLMNASVNNMNSDIVNVNKKITKSAKKLENELDNLSLEINNTANVLKVKNEKQD